MCIDFDSMRFNESSCKVSIAGGFKYATSLYYSVLKGLLFPWLTSIAPSLSLSFCVCLSFHRVFNSSSRSLFISTGIVIAFDTMAYFGFRFAHPQKMPDPSKSMPTIQWMRWWDPKTHTNNLLNAPKIIWTLLMREIKDVRANTVIVLSTNPTHTHTRKNKPRNIHRIDGIDGTMKSHKWMNSIAGNMNCQLNYENRRCCTLRLNVWFMNIY